MITAQDYFEQNKDNAQECLSTLIIKVENVSGGDSIFVDMGLPIQTTAPENGYLVSGQTSEGKFSRFVSFEEFDKEVKPVFDYYPIKGDRNLPADAEIKEVEKGQEIYTQPWSDSKLGVISKADKDGFLVTLPEDGQPKFYSTVDFSAIFNTSSYGVLNEPQGHFMRCIDDEPVQYVVLKDAVTFDFQDGPYEAAAGMVLVENKDDVDGFTVWFADEFDARYELADANAPSSDNEINGPA